MTLECAICMHTIEVTDRIWSCYTCFGAFHLACANKWAEHCILDKYFWSCPLCCSECEDALPLEPYCFCGKAHKPTKTSCGEICGRYKKCGHDCNIPCHSGPCPPCGVISTISCWCGKQEVQTICGEENKAHGSCGAVCGKKLKCGNHVCQEICHSGPCKGCKIKSKQSCFCGAVVAEKSCRKPVASNIDPVSKLERTFTCHKPCKKELPCGHFCPKNCHSGSCVKKSDLEVPGCTNNCGKTRYCGHVCGSKCHPQSLCGEHSCLVLIPVHCQCGRLTANVHCTVLERSEKGPDRYITCNAACEKVKRIIALAEQDLSDDFTLPKYSEDLISFAKLNMDFIVEMEKIFNKLINKIESYPFDPMPLWKRKFVFELADHYELDHYAIDSSKNRIPFISKTKHSSVPYILLSEVADETDQYLALKHKIDTIEGKRKEQVASQKEKRPNVSKKSKINEEKLQRVLEPVVVLTSNAYSVLVED